jgi:XTP/dITP diphosphohydrolase
VLVLGTANRKKGLELAELLAPVGIPLRTLADFPDAISVSEEGDTFAANAALKAVEQARHLGCWVLAEDSGLMVDALGGVPGVLSARYSGPEATDESNNRRLLEQLGDTPVEERTARFVCHMTLSDPSGAIRAESEARCRGRILFAPRGTHGFGYDPLFEIVEYHRPFAELGPRVKACLSHRARAAAGMIPRLSELADAGEGLGARGRESGGRDQGG